MSLDKSGWSPRMAELDALIAAGLGDKRPRPQRDPSEPVWGHKPGWQAEHRRINELVAAEMRAKYLRRGRGCRTRAKVIAARVGSMK